MLFPPTSQRFRRLQSKAVSVRLFYPKQLTLIFALGVLNQLGIVTGILLTQALGIVLAAPTLWRVVPLIAAGLALAQLLLSVRAVDSPAWLASTSRIPASKAAAAELWGDSILAPPVRSGLSPFVSCHYPPHTRRSLTRLVTGRRGPPCSCRR